MFPVDTVKTLQQGTIGAGGSMAATVRQLWGGGGLRAFFPGWQVCSHFATIKIRGGYGSVVWPVYL
jgi:hypothetical protein